MQIALQERIICITINMTMTVTVYEWYLRTTPKVPEPVLIACFMQDLLVNIMNTASPFGSNLMPLVKHKVCFKNSSCSLLA